VINEETLRTAAQMAEEGMAGAKGREGREYRRLQRKLSRFYGRKRHTFSGRQFRIAVGTAMAVAVLGVCLLMFYPDTWTTPLDWIKAWTGNTPHYAFTEPSTEYIALAWELEWIPEGYVETERAEEGEFGRICYENEEKQRIVFTFGIPDVSANAEVAPASDEKHRTVMVSGQKADLLYRQADTAAPGNGEPVYISCSLSWVSTDGNTLFCLNASLSPDELIRIAESIPQDDGTQNNS